MFDFIPENAIGPIITGIFGVMIVIAGAVMARRGARLGSKDNRAPDVQELWAQQESDRRMRQLIEDLWWALRRAFQSYYRRVSSAIEKLDLTPAQRKVFDLNATERKAIEAGLPEEPK